MLVVVYSMSGKALKHSADSGKYASGKEVTKFSGVNGATEPLMLGLF